MACWIETEKGIWWRGEFTMRVNNILRNARHDPKRRKRKQLKLSRPLNKVITKQLSYPKSVNKKDVYS
jgi:hypothetical protein